MTDSICSNAMYIKRPRSVIFISSIHPAPRDFQISQFNLATMKLWYLLALFFAVSTFRLNNFSTGMDNEVDTGVETDMDNESLRSVMDLSRHFTHTKSKKDCDYLRTRWYVDSLAQVQCDSILVAYHHRLILEHNFGKQSKSSEYHNPRVRSNCHNRLISWMGSLPVAVY